MGYDIACQSQHLENALQINNILMERYKKGLSSKDKKTIYTIIFPYSE